MAHPGRITRTAFLFGASGGDRFVGGARGSAQWLAGDGVGPCSEVGIRRGAVRRLERGGSSWDHEPGWSEEAP